MTSLKMQRQTIRYRDCELLIFTCISDSFLKGNSILLSKTKGNNRNDIKFINPKLIDNYLISSTITVCRINIHTQIIYCCNYIFERINCLILQSSKKNIMVE